VKTGLGSAPHLLHELGGKLQQADAVRWIPACCRPLSKTMRNTRTPTPPRSNRYGENLYLLPIFSDSSPLTIVSLEAQAVFLRTQYISAQGQGSHGLAWQRALAGSLRS